MSLRIEAKKSDPKTLVLYWEEEVWRCVYKPLFFSGLKKISPDLSWEEFLSQFTAMEQTVAKRYVIWLLSRKIYLSSDLMAKLLSKGFSSSISCEIISLCQAKGYLDDSQEMARLIAKEQRKGLSTKAIYCKLKARKGIDESLIRQLLQKSSSLDEEVLQGLLNKHAKKVNFKDPKDRNKLIAKLCRRGFSPESVIRALSK